MIKKHHYPVRGFLVTNFSLPSEARPLSLPPGPSSKPFHSGVTCYPRNLLASPVILPEDKLLVMLRHERNISVGQKASGESSLDIGPETLALPDLWMLLL